MSQKIENSKRQIDTHFDGVTYWLNSQFLAEEQKAALAEHFAEFLLRYKVFVNAVADGGDSTQAVENIQAWAGVLPEYVKQSDRYPDRAD